MENKILIAALSVLILAGAASAVMIPAKSIVNPLTQTLYVPNNGVNPAVIKVYTRNTSGWTFSKDISLVSGAKCYSLAVTPDGKQLLVPVNNGATSELRAYSLDISGIPTSTNFKAVKGWATASSSPLGITLHPTGIAAYLADGGTGKIHLFIFNEDNWSFVSSIGGTLDLIGIYDVAAASSKLFVSRKTNPGKIFVYDLFWGLLADKPSSSIEATAPTYLKVVNDNKLYVAVNGASKEDIWVYNITASGLSGKLTISNPAISGAYGWTGFDVSPDGTTLYYTQAQDINETSTKLYKVTGLPIASSKTATAVQAINQSDSLVIAPDNGHFSITYSGTGAKQDLKIDNDGNGNPDYLKPIISSISPATVEKGKSVDVVISGKYFLSNSEPYLSTEKLDSPKVVSSTQINATVTAAISDKFIPGAYDVSVKTGTNIATLAKAFTITEPPVVNNSPSVEAPLLQYGKKADGTLAKIDAGGISKFKTMVFKFSMSDPDASSAHPVILVPRVKFVDYATKAETFYTGNPITSTDSTKPVAGTVEVANIKDGEYQWFAQASENYSAKLVSPWVAFPAAHYSFELKADTTAPKVVSVIPSYESTVAIDTPIKITFDEAMDTTFLKVELYDGTQNKPVNELLTGQQWSADQKTVTLLHNNINKDTEYNVVIKDARDEAGNAMPKTLNIAYTWPFYTPKNQAPKPFKLIAPDQEIVPVKPGFHWEQADDPDDGAEKMVYTIVIYNKDDTVAAMKEVAEDLLIPAGQFPVSPLNPGKYTWNGYVTDKQIPKSVSSSNGPLTLEAIADNGLLPEVVSTVPANNETGVAVNQDFIITFSEPMDKKSFGIKVMPNLTINETDKTWSEGQTKLTIKHKNFTSNTLYTIEAVAKDVYGNSLKNNIYSWKFTTLNCEGGSPPSDFSLVSPQDASTVSLTPTLVWQKAQDPDQGDVVVKYSIALQQLNAQGTPISTSVISLSSSEAASPGKPDTECAYTFAQALTAGLYKWQVLASDKCGNLKASKELYSFTASEASTVQVKPGSVSIKRDGDVVGSTVTISWQLDNVTDPEQGKTAVAIYAQDGQELKYKPEQETIDSWKSADISGIIYDTQTKEYKWTDQSAEGKVGSGTSRFYKIVPTGTDLNQLIMGGNFTQDIVGKFDIEVAVSDPDNPTTKIFVSLPLSPESESISSIIGKQGQMGDVIATIDSENNPIEAVMYDNTSGWTIDIGYPLLKDLKMGSGYAYAATAGKNITIVGKVNELVENTLPLSGDAKANFIGTYYPVQVPISAESTGMNATAIGTIFALIKSDANLAEMDMHDDVTKWTNYINEPPVPPGIMEPGRGYYLLLPGGSLNTTWTQKKPY